MIRNVLMRDAARTQQGNQQGNRFEDEISMGSSHLCFICVHLWLKWFCGGSVGQIMACLPP